uniref:CCR4-NOT transcription complex subunit 3 n=1 Tax=Rhizophora mucronata TaxID=61149 RepID=A0A2P2MG73_RHIMU
MTKRTKYFFQKRKQTTKLIVENTFDPVQINLKKI